LPIVMIDQREMRSQVAKQLERLGCDITFKTLEVGDYVASDRVAFERKTADDFLKSWLDEKKLWRQLHDLCSSYERPVLIVEGEWDALYFSRRVRLKSVEGVLNAIAVSFRCPIRYTLNASETAEVITAIAIKEQETEKRPLILHGKRSHLLPSEIKEYVVEAVPDLGPVLARNLLLRFDNVQSIFSASREQLMEVSKVGPETAERIRFVAGGSYAEDCKDEEGARVRGREGCQIKS
jgi:ERCC4-type nuclease